MNFTNLNAVRGVIEERSEAYYPYVERVPEYSTQKCAEYKVFSIRTLILGRLVLSSSPTPRSLQSR